MTAYQQLDAKIAAAKMEKAAKLFDHNAAIYTDRAAYLKSLDCKTRDEAVKMLAVVQEVSVRKVNGVVCVF